MATPSVTNTLVAGTSANAADLNTNYNDLVTFLANEVLHKDGSKALTGNISAGGFKITNLGAPSSDNDAARKVYVDDAVAFANQHVVNKFNSNSGTVALSTSETAVLTASITIPASWSSYEMMAIGSFYAVDASGTNEGTGVGVFGRIRSTSAAGTLWTPSGISGFELSNAQDAEANQLTTARHLTGQSSTGARTVAFCAYRGSEYAVNASDLALQVIAFRIS